MNELTKDRLLLLSLWGLDQTGTIEVKKADFLNCDHVVRLLRKADVVLTNNYAFASSTNEALTRLFLEMKEGAKIISLKDFRTGANRNGPESILKVVKYSYPPDRNYVSWTNADGCYFGKFVHCFINKKIQLRF